MKKMQDTNGGDEDCPVRCVFSRKTPCLLGIEQVRLPTRARVDSPIAREDLLRKTIDNCLIVLYPRQEAGYLAELIDG